MKCKSMHFVGKPAIILLMLGAILCSCTVKQMSVDSASQDNGERIQASVNTSGETTSVDPNSKSDTGEKLPATSQGCDDLVSEENIKSQIKVSVGIPFRFWNSQAQELHCISFFDTYAKREVERKTIPAHEEQDNLEWNVTGKILSVTGSWNEDFEINMSTKTATSLSDGMVYDIVPGNIIAESTPE